MFNAVALTAPTTQLPVGTPPLPNVAFVAFIAAAGGSDDVVNVCGLPLRWLMVVVVAVAIAVVTAVIHFFIVVNKYVCVYE